MLEFQPCVNLLLRLPMLAESSLPLGLPLVLAQAKAGAATAALLTFIGYTLAVFVLAWFSHQVLAKKKFLSEYFLGSRGLGLVAFTLTYGATSASAGTFAGFPSLIYTHGWVLALWIASYMVVPLCGMGLMGKRLNQIARKSGAITVPDVFRERFASPALAIVSTLLIVFMLSFYLIPQFKIASVILKELLADVQSLHTLSESLTIYKNRFSWLVEVDAEYLLCLVVFAVLVILYTAFGGFRAVVWTDVMQGFVMLFGVAAMLILALWRTGGLHEVSERMARMTPPELGSVRFVTETPTETGLRVPSDQWFEMADEAAGDGAMMLLRTNELAVVPPSDPDPDEEAPIFRSNVVKVVRITTPEEIEDVLSRFPGGHPPALEGGLVPVFAGINEGETGELRPYKYGAGQAGVYVSAPGPQPPDSEKEMLRLAKDGEPQTPETAALGFLPLSVAFSFFFYWALSGAGQPGNMVRLMAFDSAKTLRRAICVLSVYFGLIYFPLVIIFCCGRVLVPGMDHDPDRIMPVLAFNLAQGAGIPWLAGLLVAAPFAAAMSTVDSFMLMISSSVVRDIYQQNIDPKASERTVKWLSYACTLIIGAVVAIGAINPPNFLQYLIVFTGGGLAAAFLLPMVMTLYWRRANMPGVLCAMIGGFSVYLGAYVAGGGLTPIRPLGIDPLVWAFLAALVVGIGVSLATAPPPAALVRKYFYRDESP